MQFINIVVHSVEDMNFRVHLQYEFTKLGLDEYLDVSMARFLHVAGARQMGELICSVRLLACVGLAWRAGLLLPLP